MHIAILFLLALCKYGLAAEDEAPLVEISQGLLRGRFMQSVHGRRISAFMNIPYAEPPLGELRFKSPVPAKGWDGVRDASEDAAICIQNNPYLRMNEVSGSEDCLYLNVYVPTKLLEQAVSLPVMVFFHGGGWLCGAGNNFWYPPVRLLDRDVVYVGVNYRLGILGLLSTLDESSPGNYALKDQNLALKWIKDNIYQFGGDPNLVTIFGESAGGASVHYHMLSPKSKGLFHRAISHSGTILSSWAHAVPGMTERNGQLLAKHIGCPNDDSKAFVECLRTKSAKELVDVETHLHKWDQDPMIPFRPIVEPKHKDAFLSEDPRVIIKEGRFNQVPWMLGANKAEGAIRSSNIYSIKELRDEFSKNFDEIAPITFEYDSADDVEKITQAIKEFYLNGRSEMSEKTIDGITDIYSDVHFTNGINEAMELHLPKSRYPIYMYYFTYRGKNSFSQIFGNTTRDYGTCHVDELLYLFHIGFFPIELNEKDARMSEILLTLWTNFATSGNPNEPNPLKDVEAAEWESINSVDEMNYFEIGDELKMGKNLLQERVDFWKQFKLWPKKYSAVYQKDNVHSEL